jgi:hypothetical protein
VSLVVGKGQQGRIAESHVIGKESCRIDIGTFFKSEIRKNKGYLFPHNFFPVIRDSAILEPPYSNDRTHAPCAPRSRFTQQMGSWELETRNALKGLICLKLNLFCMLHEGREITEEIS